MYSPFKYSPTVAAIERANDLIDLGKCKPNANDMDSNSRKRSRGAFDQEDTDIIFKELVKDLNCFDLLPTFRTLVLDRFYLLLSYNTNHEYFDEITRIIHSFKNIIAIADKHYYTAPDQKQDLYYFLSQELKRLLHHSQQTIMLFHLSADSPPT